MPHLAPAAAILLFCHSPITFDANDDVLICRIESDIATSSSRALSQAQADAVQQIFGAFVDRYAQCSQPVLATMPTGNGFVASRTNLPGPRQNEDVGVTIWPDWRLPNHTHHFTDYSYGVMIGEDALMLSEGAKRAVVLINKPEDLYALPIGFKAVKCAGGKWIVLSNSNDVAMHESLAQLEKWQEHIWRGVQADKAYLMCKGAFLLVEWKGDCVLYSASTRKELGRVPGRVYGDAQYLWWDDAVLIRTEERFAKLYVSPEGVLELRRTKVPSNEAPFRPSPSGSYVLTREELAFGDVKLHVRQVDVKTDDFDSMPSDAAPLGWLSVRPSAETMSSNAEAPTSAPD